MLDLKACVRLDEHEPPSIGLVHHELERAEATVVESRRQFDCSRCDLVTEPGLKRRARRYLQQLLVPPLHAALAFPEVAHAAAIVSDDLYLDVPGP